MNKPLKFSIVIANYNYGRFVSRAIDSALNLAWPEVEVVVVDDGSTDNSIEILEAYGARIRTVFQENSGQRIANNIGFAESSGDVIIFLDADDILLPEIAAEIALAWHEGVSKVQLQMRRLTRTNTRWTRSCRACANRRRQREYAVGRQRPANIPAHPVREMPMRGRF